MGGIAARNKAAKEATAHVFGEKAAIAGPADVLLALHKGAAVKQFADAIVFFNNPQRMAQQYPQATHDPLYIGVRQPQPTDVWPWMPVVFEPVPPGRLKSAYTQTRRR